MAYQIRFSESGRASFNRLDNSIKLQIQKYLREVADLENPKVRGEPLTSNLSKHWRYRVGNYRIIVEIKENELVIFIINIAHRSKVYKETDKRLNK